MPKYLGSSITIVLSALYFLGGVSKLNSGVVSEPIIGAPMLFLGTLAYILGKRRKLRASMDASFAVEIISIGAALFLFFGRGEKALANLTLYNGADAVLQFGGIAAYFLLLIFYHPTIDKAEVATLSAPVPQPHNAPTAKSESYPRPDNNAHPSFQSQPSAPPRIYAPPPVPTASYPAPPTPAAQFSHSASDEDIYEMIAKEIADGSVKAGLWTRLFAEASGDENRTKALYIARRAEMLMAERQSVRDQEAARIDEARRQDAERRKKESFFRTVRLIEEHIPKL